MDATVDDFLKEINEIVPPKARSNGKSTWKECFDDKSGYSYYWNMQTDEVTWQAPEGYKPTGDHAKSKPRNKLYIPPKTESLIERLGAIPPVRGDSVKIYKLDDLTKPKTPPARTIKDDDVRKVIKNTKRPSSDSEDEKIILISSYGGETESENEEDDATKPAVKDDTQVLGSSSPVNASKSNESDAEDDETDLLTQIQNRAKVLKDLGGELPESVKKLVSDDFAIETKFEKKDVTGFSLVAGYGDDSDEDDEMKSLFPIGSPKPKPENNVAHSTLFPISEQIDVNQFLDKADDVPAVVEENVAVKAFQRKRRIGIDLVNPQKRRPEADKSERSGLGFKATVDYPGFKSGGVMFIKPNDKQPTLSPQHNGADDVNEDCKEGKLIEEIDRIQGILGEKLKFLCEGHSPALPVQIMIIQMETLSTAMKAQSLNPAYLKTWLKDTCEELVKLEKEAAPNGWLLQWDRLHKRYYYHNQSTGESQWEYPQPDVVREDDAMDICTTPPPPVEDNESMNMILPPPPPRITERNITPPPPPVISGCKEVIDDSEPLPPGVDASDIPKLEPIKVTQDVPANDSLSTALDSFYSDIAAIEIQTPAAVEEAVVKVAPPLIVEHPPAIQNSKKKKKTKMAQGLAMKKKGVSKLVEKWKNVQKNYD